MRARLAAPYAVGCQEAYYARSSCRDAWHRCGLWPPKREQRRRHSHTTHRATLGCTTGAAATAGSRPPTKQGLQGQDCQTPALFSGYLGRPMMSAVAHTDIPPSTPRMESRQASLPLTQRQDWRLAADKHCRSVKPGRCLPRLAAHTPPGAACLANQQAPLLPAFSLVLWVYLVLSLLLASAAAA